MTAPPLDTERIRRNFDGHADGYDRYARVQKRVAARLAGSVHGVARPTGPILDLGCGTGCAALELAALEPQARFALSDIAHGMTCQARQRLPQALAADADAQALPYRDACFAAVVSTSVFQWVEDLPGVFTECTRVLKPGGLFAFALFSDGTLRELRESFREALARTGSTHPFHFQLFPTQAAVTVALATAGLEVLDCRAEEEREHHPTFRDLMSSLKGIGALNASRHRPTGIFPRRVMAEMTSLYGERFLAPEGLPATYAVVYGLARKQPARPKRD